MELKDTTSNRAHAGMRAIVSNAGDDRFAELLPRLRFHVIGLYYAEIGSEWDSAGMSESDFVHHIEISLSGRRQLMFQDQKFPLKPGMAYFLPGNFPVRRRCNQRCEVLFIKFRCEWLPGVDPLLDWPDRRPMCIGPCDTAAWQEWLVPGFKAGCNPLLELRGAVEGWMARALPDLNVLIGRHLESHTKYQDVFRTVEEKLGAGLRVEELARIHGTNADSFSSGFTRAIGMSPKEYLMRRLNQEAIRLVINTDLRIKEVAEQLGFNDEFYFSRFFQKLNGQSPSNCRKGFRAH